MATHVIHRVQASLRGIQDASTLKRARLTSQAYFVLMTFGLWLGVGLPAVWGGYLNGALLLIGGFSTYKVFTGVRVTI